MGVLQSTRVRSTDLVSETCCIDEALAVPNCLREAALVAASSVRRRKRAAPLVFPQPAACDRVCANDSVFMALIYHLLRVLVLGVTAAAVDGQFLCFIVVAYHVVSPGAGSVYGSGRMRAACLPLQVKHRPNLRSLYT
ncbi:jg762 [Pararge aegeria aegeria]|uniref:Jg762 protein n=1 Tax=Pararge aegeria aegeria TaxID=348720 RepID=A0A8S4SCH1_9NEOP|nr:jg762 [Pararge aegeria aegeria]